MLRRRFLNQTTCLLATAALLPAHTHIPSEKLRIAIIGHTGRGDFGHEMDTLWLDIENTEIVGVSDQDPDGLRKAAARLGDVPAFSDYREMLAKTRPDAISIAPRHIDQRREMLLAALQSGAKAIYCEKPFAATLAEADEILTLARRKDIKIALAHRMRSHPVIPVIRQYIESG